MKALQEWIVRWLLGSQNMYRPYSDAQNRRLFSSHVFVIMAIWAGFYMFAIGSALFEVDWSGSSLSADIGHSELSRAADRGQLNTVAANSLRLPALHP
jgi:hypothetical protein